MSSKVIEKDQEYKSSIKESFVGAGVLLSAGYGISIVAETAMPGITAKLASVHAAFMQSGQQFANHLHSSPAALTAFTSTLAVGVGLIAYASYKDNKNRKETEATKAVDQSLDSVSSMLKESSFDLNPDNVSLQHLSEIKLEDFEPIEIEVSKEKSRHLDNGPGLGH